MILFKTKEQKISAHLAKGDKFRSKGNYRGALKEFKKALELDPDTEGIYDRLVETLDASDEEWKIENFADSVEWTMKKQELEHPEIRELHLKLTPEWALATKLAMDIIISKDEEEVRRLTNKLVAMGEISTRALISLLIDLKK